MAFGAALTKGRAVGLCIALCLGTCLEWYDFSVFAQFSSIFTQLFFPSNEPLTAYLTFWGIYVAGFASRPIGSIFFGRIADCNGRRPALLSTISLLVFTTVGIGCLPTYEMVGVAAPIALVALRFLQGLAMGGEFGSAVVYLYEMGPPGSKGILSCLAQFMLAPGITAGIGARFAVLYFCSQDQLMLWGWRVPFLAVAAVAPLAVLPRIGMPEPHEYQQNKQELVLWRIASRAAAAVARRFARQQKKQRRTATLRQQPISTRHVRQQLQANTRIVLTPTGSVESEYSSPRAAAAVGADSASDVYAPSSYCESSATGAAAAVAAAAAGGHEAASAIQSTILPPTPTAAMHQQYKQRLHLQAPSKGYEEIGCEAQYVAEMQRMGRHLKHHSPLLLLLGGHLQGVWLQFFLEASYAATFFVFFSWLPLCLHSSTQLSIQQTQFAVMIGMGAFSVAVLYSGWMADKGIPKVYALMATALIISAVAVPVLYVLHKGSVICLLVLLPAMLGLSGSIGGLMTSIGPQIYPAGVRATGYSIAHSLAMSTWGGLSPYMITGIGLIIKPPALAAGVLLVAVGVVSWSAAIPLSKIAPQTNARGAAEPKQPRRRSSTATAAATAAAAAVNPGHEMNPPRLPCQVGPARLELNSQPRADGPVSQLLTTVTVVDCTPGSSNP